MVETSDLVTKEQDTNLTEPKQEPIKKEVTMFNNVFNIESLLNTSGTLDLTPEQDNILFSPVNSDDVEIRPDGLIYLPFMEYATRLRKAFGCKWALIPNGMPVIKDNAVLWGFYLIINGKLMGFSIGEQEYTNDKMGYTDACEGAKSNALMRLCKGIGITLELWKPSFVRDWKEKHSYSYWDEKKKKYLWKKENPTNNNQPHSEQPKTEQTITEQEKQNAIESGLADNEPAQPEKPDTKTGTSAVCEYKKPDGNICGFKITNQKTIDYSIKYCNRKIYCYNCQQIIKKGVKK